MGFAFEQVFLAGVLGAWAYLIGRRVKHIKPLVHKFRIALIVAALGLISVPLWTLIEVVGRPQFAAYARGGGGTHSSPSVGRLGIRKGSSVGVFRVPDGEFTKTHIQSSGEMRVCYRVGRFSGRVYADDWDYCKRRSECTSCRDATLREW